MLHSSKARHWLVRIALILVAYGLYAYWPYEYEIEVSPETTHLTEPVNPDGTIDYVAGFNRMCNKGVTAKNNAVPLLAQALGKWWSGPDDAVNAALRRLGVEPLPEDAQYFVSAQEYEEQADRRAPRQPADHKERDFLERVDKATLRPWSAADFPDVAAWLRVNEKPLAVALEASRRPRCHLPLVSTRRPASMTQGSLRVFPLGCPDIAEALAARAMMKLEGGDVQGAQAELMACHRLARLIGQEPLLIGRLTAWNVQLFAADGTAAAATSGKLSARQAKAFLDDLHSLAPLSDFAECIDKGERFFTLDVVMELSRGTPLSEITGSEGREDTGVNADWNVMLRTFNVWFDRFVALYRLPYPERKAAEASVYGELPNVVWASPALAVRLFVLKWGGRPFRTAYTRHLTQLMMSWNMLFGPDAFSSLHDAAHMRFDLCRVAMALAACRAETGHYPEKLSELSPTYLEDVPADLYTAEPLQYALRGAGYLLYSVGPNMTDDGGTMDEDADRPEDPDDLSVVVE